MNRLEGRFAAGQIPGGREYQEDDFGLIERGDADVDRRRGAGAGRRDGGARERRYGQQNGRQDVRGDLSRHGRSDPGPTARLSRWRPMTPSPTRRAKTPK